MRHQIPQPQPRSTPARKTLRIIKPGSKEGRRVLEQLQKDRHDKIKLGGRHW